MGAVGNNPTMKAKYQNNQMIPVAQVGLGDIGKVKRKHTTKIREQQGLCSFSLYSGVTLASIKLQNSFWFSELHSLDTGCDLFHTQSVKCHWRPFTAGWSQRRTKLAGMGFGQKNGPGKFSSNVLKHERERGSVLQNF